MSDRRMWALAALATTAGLGLWLAIAVAGPSGSPPSTVSLSYVTQVDATDVTPVGDAWQVTTDLGFEVTVDSYVLQTWSAVVGACADDTDTDGLAVTDLFTVDTAGAGHSEATDPAQATGPVEQAMATDAEPVAVGEGTIAADALCTAHVAVAGGEGSGEGRTEPTIEVTGTYVAPRSQEPVEFAITSDQAWGGVSDLNEVELGAETMSVVVVRDLSALFDGVDMSAEDDGERARSLLRSLSEATRVDVVPTT